MYFCACACSLYGLAIENHLSGHVSSQRRKVEWILSVASLKFNCTVDWRSKAAIWRVFTVCMYVYIWMFMEYCEIFYPVYLDICDGHVQMSRICVLSFCPVCQWELSIIAPTDSITLFNNLHWHGHQQSPLTFINQQERDRDRI